MTIITGTSASETLYGTAGIDTIRALGGDDTLKGGGGADVLDGGAGIDTAFYSDSSSGVSVNLATGSGTGGTAQDDSLIDIENLYGSAFQDLLTGNGGANELHGQQGNDILQGGGGNDALYGDDGNDNLKGGGGADVLAGGAGIDQANYNQSSVGVFVSLITNTGAFGDAEGDTFSGIENVIGSGQADNLWGDDGVNALSGMGGNDTLKGFGGNDFLVGGDGIDQLFGQLGNDYLDAGDGTDTLDGGAGNDFLEGWTGVDTMRGGIGDDKYVVDTAADIVVEALGEGTDTVLARGTYVLGAGSEVEVLQAYDVTSTTPFDLVGNEFDNTIVGNNGQNTIVGGLGQDTMTGNGAGDVFVWTSTAESSVAGQLADVVRFFDPLVGDLLAFNAIDADETVAGNQAFTFIGTIDISQPAGFFTAPGQIGFFTTPTDTFILLNTDGDAFQEMTVRVTGVHTVDTSWFVL